MAPSETLHPDEPSGSSPSPGPRTLTAAPRSRSHLLGLGVALGAGLGAGLGAAVDDMAIGVAVGIALGVVLSGILGLTAVTVPPDS